MSQAAAVFAKAVELGKLSLRMTAAAGSGHPSSALSLAHLVTYLMYRQMRWDPADPWHPAADRLVLSEGHAVPIVYAAYADLGGMVVERGQRRRLTIDDLDTLRARDSVLDGHPNPAEGFPFFDAATGSLGQGLSVAAGLGLAARQAGSDRRIYCLIGDGESREGQIWEALDFIVDHKLTNVCPIFNANGHGQAAPVSQQQATARLVAKLEAFGYEVAEIDGHDPEQIAAALVRVETQRPTPLAIVARTVKGWGVDLMIGSNWHGKPLKPEQLDEAYASLDRVLAEKLGDAPAAALEGPPPPPAGGRLAAADPAEVRWPPFAEAMEAAGLGAALEKGKLATRRAYGAALKVAGDLLPQVVALDGDVSNSTFANIFGKRYPERFFECKIAEQNMVSAAAGLSAAGCIPFANSFAKFLARAYDQIEMANISRANVKLVGSHAGISLAADGPSQMALLDVAYFGALAGVPGDDRESPLCWFFHPADAVAAYHLTRLMTTLRGMCYMRTHRPDVPLIYEPNQAFEPGGCHVVRDGEDVALVAAGYMVHEALRAAELLARQNVRAAVVDVYCLPVCGETLRETLRRCGGTALVVEDNYPGLGPIVAAAAAEDGSLRVETLACRRIPKSTLSPDEALDYCGVAATQIADHTNALLRSR